MESAKKIIFFILVLYIAISCSKKDEPYYDGFSKDSIELSCKLANFTKDKDSAIIKTKGDWWWFSSVNCQDSIVVARPNDRAISGGWFLVEKKDKKTISISVEENKTDNERGFTIVLQSGNYVDYITVSQE